MKKFYYFCPEKSIVESLSVRFMNKILASLFLSMTLLLSVNATAARLVISEGDFEAVACDAPVKVVIDFNSTKVAGLSLDEFLTDINHSGEFKHELNNYYADFIKRFNRKCEMLMLTRSGDRAVLLTVNVKTINTKGNEAYIEYVFSDVATGQRLVVVTGTTKEGLIGSFSNLVGDVIREAGGELGDFVARKMRKTNVVDDPIY